MQYSFSSIWAGMGLISVPSSCSILNLMGQRERANGDGCGYHRCKVPSKPQFLSLSSLKLVHGLFQSRRYKTLDIKHLTHMISIMSPSLLTG